MNTIFHWIPPAFWMFAWMALMCLFVYVRSAYVSRREADEKARAEGRHRHKWIDSDEPDMRLPMTYYQICTVCGCRDEDDYGRYVGDYSKEGA